MRYYLPAMLIVSVIACSTLPACSFLTPDSFPEHKAERTELRQQQASEKQALSATNQAEREALRAKHEEQRTALRAVHAAEVAASAARTAAEVKAAQIKLKAARQQLVQALTQ